MRPADLHRALTLAVQTAGAPATFLHGPPGVGKSDLVRQVAADLGWPLVDVRAVLLDPVDLRGLPWLEQGDQGAVAKWAPPAFLPRDPGPGLLFLDELPQAPVSVQNACLQLVLDRGLGEYRLPDGWRIVAAGNRSTDRAGAGKLTTALASRFVHLDLDVSHEDWDRWALGAGIHPTVRAFLGFKSGMLWDFDPSANPERFPCPRTWAMVSRLYGALLAGGDMGLELDVVGGCVGQGAAAEFVAFSRIARDLPDPDDILADPAGADVPGSPPVLYALATSLGMRAKDMKPATVAALVAYVGRLPAEFAVLTMRDAVRSRPDLMQQAPVAKWITANQALLGV